MALKICAIFVFVFSLFISSVSSVSAQCYCSGPAGCNSWSADPATCGAHSGSGCGWYCPAPTSLPAGELPQFTGLGPLGDTSGSVNMYDRFEGVISTILAVITVFAGIWFLIQFFIAAFNWISAGADKNSLEKAQKRMTHAIIGLFLVVFAYGFTAILSLVFGIDILRPGITLQNLHP
jgi:hypothetical protein